MFKKFAERRVTLHACTLASRDVKNLVMFLQWDIIRMSNGLTCLKSEIADYIQCHVTEVGPIGTQYFS